jgi:hypothetical protein
MLDLPYPNINGESEEKKISQINNYLIRLKDALEFVLMSMSSENKAMAEMLAKGLAESNMEREDQITQVSSKISSDSDVTMSTITQVADEIRTEVRIEYELKTDASDMYMELSSSIKETSDEINLEVSKKVGEEEIVSKINQTAEGVKIDASKISLEGIVTVNENFKILETGSAEFTSNSEVWILPTADDVDRIRRVALGQETVTGNLFKAMDFNCDGKVNITDFITGKAILLGKESIDYYVNTFGYQKQTSTVTLKIIPDNAEKTICISGINSFGSYVESYFGLNVNKVDQVRAEGANIGKILCGEISTSSGNDLDAIATRLATVEAHLGISN